MHQTTMHVEQDVLRQGQDRLAVKKMNMEFDRSLDPEAGPAGMTDHYTGDENKDIKARDVQDWARDYNEKNSFEKQFDVRYCMLGALFGALIGTVFGALQVWRKNSDLSSRAQQDIMMGLFYGTMVGGLGVAAYMCFRISLDGKDKDFKKKLEEQREALRRKESEVMERHNEVIYYDAGRTQSGLYKILCCPHFGKITSERIIYSRNKPWTWDWWCPDTICWIPCGCVWRNAGWFPTQEAVYSILCSVWTKEVESLDYDLVMDVSVEQECTEFCCNTGTVVIHTAANADVSIIKDMNVRLVEALNDATNVALTKEERERKLQYARESSLQIPSLKPLRDKCEEEVNRIAKERQAEATEENPFKPIYVAQDDKNNPSRVNVLQVYKPYSVMDDLSYRISSRQNLKKKTKELVEEAQAQDGAIMNTLEAADSAV